MAQSNSSLIDFPQDGERYSTFGQTTISATSIIEAYPEYELSTDDVCAEINYGWGDSFRIVALKNAGVLIFWLLDTNGNALSEWNEERGMPNSLVLPITERNIEAANSISYDEYDSPIFDDFLSNLEYFD